jgi:hypothetical protein
MEFKPMDNQSEKRRGKSLVADQNAGPMKKRKRKTRRAHEIEKRLKQVPDCDFGRKSGESGY